MRIHPEIIASPEDDTLSIPSGVPAVKSVPHPTTEVGHEGVDNRKVNGIVIRNKGIHLEILDVFRSIAPILDATLADIECSGQVFFPSTGDGFD